MNRNSENAPLSYSVIKVSPIVSEAAVNAIGDQVQKPKKTAEEICTSLLQNLEKARAMNTLYKKQDDEAKVRGEMPPSVLRRAERYFPLILDENQNIKHFDLKSYIWDTQISMPLPQMLYYSP